MLLLLSPSPCLVMLPSPNGSHALHPISPHPPTPHPRHGAAPSFVRYLTPALPAASLRTPTDRERSLPIPRRQQRLGTTRGPGRSPAVACIEPTYLFRSLQNCRRPSYLVTYIPWLWPAAAEPMLCYCAPLTRAGMMRTCRWAELGVWPAGTGTGRGGYGLHVLWGFYYNSAAEVVVAAACLSVSGERQYCLLDETESCPVSCPV